MEMFISYKLRMVKTIGKGGSINHRCRELRRSK